jgi:carbon storage regulator CsrA
MLILKRNVDDIVDIYCHDSQGREVKVAIMVVEIGPGYIRMGVDAPKDILILRREVPLRERKKD